MSVAASRAKLIAPFAASLLLAAFAQNLFADGDKAWYIPVAQYIVAAIIFVWVAKRMDPDTTGSSSTPLHTCERVTIRMSKRRAALIALAFAASVLAAWDSTRPEHSEPFTFAVAMWVLGIGLFAAAFFPWSSMKPRRWRERINALVPFLPEMAGVLALLLLALILRGFDVEHIPLNVAGDEGEMGLIARTFLAGLTINPFGTSTFFGHQTMWFLLQGLCLRVLGDSVFGLRMLSVIAGTLTVLTTYLLVRQLFGRGLGMVTALLLAAYSFHIHFSRVALSSISDPLWTTLVFFLLVRGLATRRTGYFVAAGIALGYSQSFYLGIRLLILILAVWLLHLFWQDRQAILSQMQNLATMAVASLLTALPLIAYYVNFPKLFFEHYNAMGIFPSGWVGRVMQETGQSALAIVIDRTRRSFLFFNAIPDNSGFYASGTPLLEAISAVLFVLGLAYALYRIRDSGYFLFVAWFVLAIFFGGVMVIDENGSERLVTTSVPVMFFVGLGLAKLAETGARLGASAPRLRQAALALGVAAIAYINIRFYFVDYTPRRTYAGDGGWRLTEMARLFLAQPRPFKAYYFGAPYDYLTHGTMRFMDPTLDGMDVLKPIDGPPDFVDTSRGALFVFRPERKQELALVRQAYPDGALTGYRMQNGDELFICYEVDKP